MADRTGITPSCRTVLMVGTDPHGMGGITTVVQGYIDAGLFDRVDCTYVTTHRPGSHWVKLRAALTGWMRVWLRLRSLDAPLVHVHLSSRASFWRKSVVCALARLARRPYLLHVHGSEFAGFYEECPPAARRIVSAVLAHAALVLALSEAWRTTLQRISPRARIEVSMNAVPLPAPGELARGADRRPALLFFGEIARHKGVFELAQAFAQIASDFPGLQLVYAGTGRAVGETRELTARLGLGERVEFTGWLAAQRKQAALAGATIFVLPSYVEGMPMALLEAMSWGLPVIATSVGGVPEIVTHDIDGLLVPPGDIGALAAAIARLMSEPPLRERLGRAARATVARRFSLDSAVERLLGIYRRFGIEPREAHPAPQRPAAAGRPPRAPGLLFIVNSLETGGAEKQVVTLLNHLDTGRFRLHLAYLKREETLLRQLHAARLDEVLCCDVSHRIDRDAVRRLRELVAARHIDALICTNPYSMLYGHLAREAGARPRLAAVFHSTVLHSVKEKLQMVLYTRLFNRCDLLVYVSESQRRFWRKQGLHPPDAVVYNGVDVDFFTDRYTAGEKQSVRAALELGADDYVVGLCSTLRPEKAPVDLLRALAALHRQGVPAKALFIGDGPERPRLEHAADALGLRAHVRVTGFQQDVRPFVACCDVMTLVSHSVETFSLAALEAMALGKPVVLSETGGAADMAVPGEHGYLFQPGDTEALAGRLRMLTSPALRARLGAAAARRVRERFTVGAMTEGFSERLEELLRQPAAAARSRTRARAAGG